MAVMGLGVDIVDIQRMQRLRDKYGENFLRKVFTDAEISNCLASKRPDERFAGRFAAKEAVMKALRAGVFTGVHYRDIEVLGGGSIKPTIKLHSKAIRAAIKAGATKVSVTLSHERQFAIAMAIVED